MYNFLSFFNLLDYFRFNDNFLWWRRRFDLFFNFRLWLLFWSRSFKLRKLLFLRFFLLLSTFFLFLYFNFFNFAFFFLRLRHFNLFFWNFRPWRWHWASYRSRGPSSSHASSSSPSRWCNSSAPINLPCWSGMSICFRRRPFLGNSALFGILSFDKVLDWKFSIG